MEDNAKALGFKNTDELFLYYDVCAGRNVEPPTSYKEALMSLEDGSFYCERTKEECEDYIQSDVYLRGLFTKVKDMSEFDRLVEIYLFNANLFGISMKIEKQYERQIEKDEDIGNIKEIKELQKELDQIREAKDNYYYAMSYVEDVVAVRLDSEEEQNVFSDIIDVVSQLVTDAYTFDPSNPQKR